MHVIFFAKTAHLYGTIVMSFCVQQVNIRCWLLHETCRAEGECHPVEREGEKKKGVSPGKRWWTLDQTYANRVE